MPLTINFTHPPAITRLKQSNTHGRYMALNCVPNQNVTIVSWLNWHHTYSTAITIGSMSIIILPIKATTTQLTQQNNNMKKYSAGRPLKIPRMKWIIFSI